MIKCRVRESDILQRIAWRKSPQRMNERELSDEVNWGKKLPNWGHSKCKGPGACLHGPRNTVRRLKQRGGGGGK